jgi:hypothetical protein
MGLVDSFAGIFYGAVYLFADWLFKIYFNYQRFNETLKHQEKLFKFIISVFLDFLKRYYEKENYFLLAWICYFIL